ncbi:MAG TPA: hypothetical protein PKV08_00770, partial [Candidatus Syntrophosphaera thermopropionivorans]|nr:hypothetical protein [Candidatus Syntrophosphaera thermopropionivorans]
EAQMLGVFASEGRAQRLPVEVFEVFHLYQESKAPS